MNRRALFISVVLTVFVIAMLSGVLTIYKVFASASSQTAQVESPTNAAVLSSNPASVAPTPFQVTPTEAAAIAARYINRQDVYTVEAFVLNNVNVYKVTFSSGDLVYVSLDGQILLVQSKPKVPVYSASSSSPSSTTSYSEQEHESEADD